MASCRSVGLLSSIYLLIRIHCVCLMPGLSPILTGSPATQSSPDHLPACAGLSGSFHSCTSYGRSFFWRGMLLSRGSGRKFAHPRCSFHPHPRSCPPPLRCSPPRPSPPPLRCSSPRSCPPSQSCSPPQISPDTLPYSVLGAGAVSRALATCGSVPDGIGVAALTPHTLTVPCCSHSCGDFQCKLESPKSLSLPAYTV